MKKYIVKILIFSTILLFLVIILDYVISKGLYGSDNYKYSTWSEITNDNMDNDMIIIGSSRALSHFDPMVIDSILNIKSYNLGRGGYPFNVHDMIFKHYLNHNVKPKIVVHNVDFLTLTKLPIKHQHESEQFLPLIYDVQMRKELLNNGYNYFDICVPLYRYYGYQMVMKNGLLEFLHLKHSNSQQAYKGYYPEQGTKWNGSELSKMDSIVGSFEPIMCDEFERYLSYCKNNGIYVILVNSPVYLEATNLVTNKKMINDYYKNISNKYGFKYLNYTEDYYLCNYTNNFTVSVHLNKYASKIFSKDFANDIKSFKIFD